MPLQTETVDFDSEVERLTEEMEELADEQLQAQGDRQAQQLLERGNQLDRFRTVLRKLAAGDIDTVEAFDSVEFGGLSPGEVNLVEDIVEEHPKVRERDAWVAVGTRDAPYVEHDPERLSQSAVEETIKRLVDDVPLPFLRWAEERISDLSHLGVDEGNGYLALLQERQSDEAETEESG